ncbi:MAG: flagellar protein FlgN [Phycisphaerales bacterium JB038]
MPELRGNDLTPLVAQVQRMTALQERMLALLGQKREAIRTADGEALLKATETEGKLAAEMVALEQQRRQVVQELLAHRGLALSEPAATLKEVASLTAAGEAGDLLQAGAALRRLVEQTARENSILREAGDRLLGHLRHLSSVMHGALDRSKTYSRAGRLQVTPQLSATLDLHT